MKKVQAFMDEYSPSAMADLRDMLGGEAQQAMDVAVKELSGKIGNMTI